MATALGEQVRGKLWYIKQQLPSASAMQTAIHQVYL